MVEINLEKNDALSLKRSFFCGIAISSVFLLYHLIGARSIWFIGIALLILYTLTTRVDLLYFIIYMMPQEDLLKLDGYNFSVFSYYCLLIAALFFLKNRRLNKTFLILSSISTFTILASALISSTSYYLLPFLRFILLMYYIIEKRRYGRVSTQGALKSFVWGTCSSIIMAFVYHAINGSLFSGYFGGIANDRNYYGVLISVCICICILSIFEQKMGIKNNFHLYLCLFVCFLGLILSGSRTLILALIFPALIVFINLMDLKKIWYAILLFFVFAIIVAILSTYFSQSVDFIVGRMTDDTVGTGSGRFSIWQYYFELYIHSGIGVLFGNGPSYKVFSSSLFEAVAHNTYLEGLYGLGIVGLLSVLSMFVFMYRMICDEHKKRFVLWLPLINVLFCYLGIDGLFSNRMTILVFVSLLIIASGSTEEHMAINN